MVAKSLKERLKEAMEERKMSFPKLERITGIKASRMYKWYEENTNPKTADAEILEKWLRGELEDSPRDYLKSRRDNKLNHVAEGIPIYEESPYTLGNVESYRDTPVEKADFWITIPGLRNCNYGVRATGDSMHPLIRNHALVVGEEVTDWKTFIPSGDIYIIRAKNGIETIKYIHTHGTDNKMFVLVPYNTAAKQTDIYKKDIIKLWKAKAVFNVL